MGPREADVALETEAYKEWKKSRLSTRETCPINVKAFESVRMIEKSAYDELKATLIKLRDIERTKCPPTYFEFLDKILNHHS